MLKVLLADDEFLVRLAFSNTIKWNENGFELIGTAANGIEAYEAIQKERPDIVITDLTMPQMGGLELIEKVQAAEIHCEFVVLSCHNEFEYVKQALRLGVFDYILKLSMDMNELMDILERLKTKILTGRETAPAEAPVMDLLGQQEPGNAVYQVIVAGSGAVSPDEKERVNGQIVSFLKQMTESIADKSVFLYHDVPVLLLWQEYEGLERLLKEIQEAITDYMGVTVDIGVGSHVNGNVLIRQSFEEAMMAYGHRFYVGEKAVIFRADIHYREAGELSFSDVFPEIQEALRLGVRKELTEEISCLLDEIKKNADIEPVQVRMYLHELLARIKMQADELKPGIITGVRYADIYKQINQLEYLEDIKTDFLYFLNEVLEKLDLTEENEIVRKARGYIQANLQGDLRVLEVSRRLGVNADYFSHLFRTETGIRYIDYVNHVRIAFACERLRNSGDRIYEIAEQSGFENTNYFIKVFKKNTGMTPLDYKKSQESIKN